ncbi:MAG TPA: carbohydrate kinase family protein, partial [Steroidobacteraceae bacterium]
EWPRVGTETLMERSELRAGGSAGNAALAVSYLGGDSELLSVVGNDEPGSWLAGQLRPLNASLATCDAPTTLTVGLIRNCGERNFFTTRGHLEALSYELLRPRIAPAPAPESIALLSGVFLTPALRKCYPLLIRDLQALGYRVALDTNWPPEDWSAALRAEVAGWISCCDHVLLNDLEVRSLADSDDLAVAIDRLAPVLRRGATLVVKTGARGALGIQDGERCQHAAAQAAIFDTIGAGDSFNAGYLLARLDGAGLAASLAAGCEAATSIIARFPRRSIRAGDLAGLRARVPTALEERA